jgi:hypothetical protein
VDERALSWPLRLCCYTPVTGLNSQIVYCVSGILPLSRRATVEKLARQQLQELRIRQLTDSELDHVSGGFSQGAQGQQGRDVKSSFFICLANLLSVAALLALCAYSIGCSPLRPWLPPVF